MTELTFHDEAREEYGDAQSWYLERSQLVAARFVQAFDRAVELLLQFPEGHPKYDDCHRFIRIKKYP